MPGIAVEALLFWVPRLFPLQMYTRVSRVTNAFIWLGLIVVLGVNAVSTYEDYFVKWPQHPETQFVFQADFAAIAKDIDASDVMDVSVGGLSNDTLDDPSLYLLRNRKNVRVRWFDSGSPISSGGAVVAGGDFPRYLYIPSIVPLSPALEVYTGRPVTETANFRRFDPDTFVPNGLPFRDARRFADTAWFVRDSLPTRAIQAGSVLEFETRWIVLDDPVQYPRRIFVHIVDTQSGKIITQHDGLDAPTKFWQRWDAIAQVHKLSLPDNTPPGSYELRAGLYDPVSGQRVPLHPQFSSDSDGLDYIILGTIEVTR
jgi:hypothetical protein